MKRLPTHLAGDSVSEPQRLERTDALASDILREANTAYQADLDEARAWNRLRPTLERRARRTNRLPLAALGIAAAAAIMLFLFPGTRERLAPRAPVSASVEIPASTALTASPSAASPEPTDVAPSPAPRALALGRTRLSDGSVVHLHPASNAAVSAEQPDHTTIDLTQGTVELEVAHQTPGRHLEVVSGVYRFVALGTAFRVQTVSGQVELEVSEGTVGVMAGDKTLARVEAGKSWRTSPAASTEHTKPITNVRAPSDPGKSPPAALALTREPDCASTAREGRTREAIACYERQAAGSGMSAELAVYEAARLRRDVLSDFSGALDSLRGYQARFPRGTLRGEVEVSILGLLEKLGKNEEALSESQRLLQMAWGQERASAIHLLRGNVYRQGLRDCARAEPEYASLAEEATASGDEAQFWRAHCLERMGRPEIAAGVYEVYLRRSHPHHAAEAQARVLALSR
jgi:ferric-dicitrate binding protein FerR (iron transport regulator)